MPTPRNKPRLWTKEEDDFLLANYKTMTMAQLAEAIGRPESQIRGRKTRLGHLNKRNGDNQWTAHQLAALRQFYTVAGASAPINLGKLAELVGKERSNVCRKAKELGYPTNQGRPKTGGTLKQYSLPLNHRHPSSIKGVKMWANREHPRGMLGKNHTAEVKAAMSIKHRLNPSQKPPMSATNRLAQSRRMVEFMKTETAYSRTTKGWLEVGGKRNFYKSKWEMGYAQYLQWLKEVKNISDWDYEPETFWFEAIRRGVRSYTPDFKVTTTDGSTEFHEVKGWMDAKSATKLRRMAKYHPEVKMILIDEPVYRVLKRQMPRLFEVEVEVEVIPL